MSFEKKILRLSLLFIAGSDVFAELKSKGPIFCDVKLRRCISSRDVSSRDVRTLCPRLKSPHHLEDPVGSWP